MEMEHGYLHAPQAIGPFNYEWTKRKVMPSMTPEYVEREIIIDKQPGQIEGFRCSDDKIILFKYDQW
jgi:hypothetical protein